MSNIKSIFFENGNNRQQTIDSMQISQKWLKGTTTALYLYHKGVVRYKFQDHIEVS